MLKDSIIISGIVNIFVLLKNWFVSSGYFKLYTAVADFIGKLYKNSLLYHMFSRKAEKTGESIAANAVNKIFGFFYGILNGAFTKIGEHSKGSMVVRFCSFILKNWYSISIHYYSITLFIAVVVKFAVSNIMGRSVGSFALLLGAVSVVGILIDVSLAELYQGCGLKKIIGLPQLSEKVKMRAAVKKHIAVTGAIIAGSITGFITLIPQWYLIIAAAVGAVLVLTNPKTGIFIILCFFPFMPTMAVAGVSILVMLGMFIGYLGGSEKNVRFDMFDAAILIMCVALVYGVANSYAKTASIPIAMIYMVFVSSFYVIRRGITDKKFLYAILDTMIAVAAAVSLYGLYQMISGQAATTWQDMEMFENMSGRIYSTFGNPNVFGEYLLILIPLTFARLIMTDNGNRKFAYLVAFGLQLASMVLTYSRGCWIGLIASMGLMLMFCGKKTLALCVLGIFAVPFVIPEAIVERILSIGNTADSSTSYRVFIWEGTVKMLKDFWYCGIGIGSDAFNSVYPNYALNAITAPHSHNLYLHIICEMGIVGVFAVGLILVQYFKHISYSVPLKREFQPLAVGLGAAMAGYLIQGMFDNVWYNYRIYMFFFMLIALGAVLYDLAVKEKKQ